MGDTMKFSVGVVKRKRFDLGAWVVLFNGMVVASYDNKADAMVHRDRIMNCLGV